MNSLCLLKQSQMIEQLGHIGGHKSLKLRMNNQNLHSNILCYLSTESHWSSKSNNQEDTVIRSRMNKLGKVNIHDLLAPVIGQTLRSSRFLKIDHYSTLSDWLTHGMIKYFNKQSQMIEQLGHLGLYCK